MTDILDGNIIIELEKAQTNIEECYNLYAEELMEEIHKKFPPVFVQEENQCTYIIIPRYTDFVPIYNSNDYVTITIGEENEN